MLCNTVAFFFSFFFFNESVEVDMKVVGKFQEYFHDCTGSSDSTVVNEAVMTY